jgi:hypothetical protein
MSDAAIRTCLEEVLTGAAAVVRPFTPGELSPDIANGASDYTRLVRSDVTPLFEVSLSYSPAADQVTQPSDTWIEKLDLTISTIYTLEAEVLLAEEYRAVKSDSASLGHRIRTSLAWGGNMTTTQTGESTGILSGMLQWVSTSVTTDDAKVGLYVTKHTFTGWVMSTEAIV